MAKYRKKAVVIEAFQLTKELKINEIPSWTEVQFLQEGKCAPVETPDVGKLKLVATGAVIGTIEGPMNAAWGDYIIRGVKGEVYSCREDIFLETYEAVD